MAALDIISKDGLTTRATAYPEYNGVMMGVSSVTFRRICSQAPIAWEIGDYVTYPLVNETFYLYSTPSVTKRADMNTAGDGFVYDSVTFFSKTKDLELTPFRDFVKRDNGIHFSSRESASTFENVEGIARRIQECMDGIHPGEWEFIVFAPGEEDPESDIYEAKDISISGSCLEGLQAISDNWSGVIWRHLIVNGAHKIRIGFPSDIVGSTDDFSIHQGLLSIKCSVANSDGIITRIYPFGSERNLPSRHYNGKDILNAESVDIPNLMIPITEWGISEQSGENKPDPEKAFIEDSEAIDIFGLRPRRVYFNGSDGNEDIYPTISGVTIGDVLSDYQYSEYAPNKSIWADESQRVDEVIAVIGADDTGEVSEDGFAFAKMVKSSHNQESNFYRGERNYSVVVDSLQLSGTSKTIKMESTRVFTLTSVSVSDYYFTGYKWKLYDSDGNLIAQTPSGWVFGDDTQTIASGASITVDRNIARVDLEVSFSADSTGIIRLIRSSGYTAVYEKVPVLGTFKLRIPQIGFDIDQQASLGSGITLSMKDGACAGREFEVTKCEYESETDTWLLTMNRQEDTSLNTLFPNSNGYPIEPGDHFVILDIAMPEMYVSIAEARLLAAAQKKLSELSNEEMQIELEIDNLYVKRNMASIIKECEYFSLVETDLFDGDAPDCLIDSITITEGGASNIPVYKLSLRNKKKTTFNMVIKAAAGAEKNNRSAIIVNKTYAEKMIRRILNENV